MNVCLLSLLALHLLVMPSVYCMRFCLRLNACIHACMHACSPKVQQEQARDLVLGWSVDINFKAEVSKR